MNILVIHAGSTSLKFGVFDAEAPATSSAGTGKMHHANPPADPARYRDTPGVLMTHCFNRLYTVSSLPQ
jgi:hypothetical protein